MFDGKDTYSFISNIKSNVKCTTLKYVENKHEIVLSERFFSSSMKHVVMCLIKQFCDIFGETGFFLQFETC